MALRFLTAGESHGPALTIIIEGMPAGVPLPRDTIDRELIRRMGGYGRGGRMKIEKDRVQFEGGVRFGKSMGSPIACRIVNLDYKNWLDVMAPEGEPSEARSLTRPRPGHADLVGSLKYRTYDARDILERASARETAARTVAGAVAKCLLEAIGAKVTSRTVSVGDVTDESFQIDQLDALLQLPDDAPLRVLDSQIEQRMIQAIEAVRKKGDSIGGAFEVLASGVPLGLGSHVHWDRKLDGLLGGALMSIQAVKAVSVGEGIEGATRTGSSHHDAIYYDEANQKFYRKTNRAGGVEGGMSNGECIRATGYLKPLATLPKALPSVDLKTKESFEAQRERTDTIPIVAAGVVGETMVAWVLAKELLRKFGGDSLSELSERMESHRSALKNY